MDESLIKLLIWIIAHEITKDQGSKENQQNVFHRLIHLLSGEFNDCINNDDPLSDSLIKLGMEMIYFYYNHFTENCDGTLKLIESDIPLINGRFKRKFREMDDTIGSGNFGKVCRAKSLVDHKEYAIKKVQLYGKIFIL